MTRKYYELDDAAASGMPPLLSNVDENEGTGAVVLGSSLPCSTQHSKNKGPAWTDRIGVVAVPPTARPSSGLFSVGVWRLG